MTKNQRNYIAVCRDAGLHPLGIEARGKHWAVVCAEGRLFCGCTPSDYRAIRNMRSFARRLARGLC